MHNISAKGKNKTSESIQLQKREWDEIKLYTLKQK